MHSTATLIHILFLNVSHMYSWTNEIWKYYSDSVYREYGIVERDFYGWNQACGAEIWQFLNGKYFPLLISPRLEGLCLGSSVPAEDHATVLQVSRALTCVHSIFSHHPVTYVKHSTFSFPAF